MLVPTAGFRRGDIDRGHDPVHGVLQIPRGAGRARRCVPTLVLDGKVYDRPRAGAPLAINDVVPVWEIRAVEIYNDRLFTPSELPVYMPADLRCGVCRHPDLPEHRRAESTLKRRYGMTPLGALLPPGS